MEMRVMSGLRVKYKERRPLISAGNYEGGAYHSLVLCIRLPEARISMDPDLEGGHSRFHSGGMYVSPAASQNYEVASTMTPPLRAENRARAAR